MWYFSLSLSFRMRRAGSSLIEGVGSGGALGGS